MRWFGRNRLFIIGGAAMLVASFAVAASATPSSFVELDGNVISNGTGTYDWANSGALTTTNNVYSRSGSGGIFDGGVFNGATTPPTAPSLTPTAAADATIADAEFKVDPLSVDVTPCGTGDPTAYTGAGSETNGDLLTSDTYGTASVPNKDDLSNVYAAAHVDGATNEVFFGAERVINNGDSHIDFEFLQSEVTKTGTCSGSFVGDRTAGDFLLSVDFTTGGTLGGTTLYKWTCPGIADGVVCNPAKKSGRAYVATGTTAVTIKVNDAATGSIGCGGWVCRNPDGSATQTILTNELMEGGIDLAQLGFSGCISTFLPHTRSSQSFTAVLKDFEIIPFNTCSTPSVTTTIVPAGPLALGSTAHHTATLTGATANAGGTITYKLYDNSTCTEPALADLTPTVNTVVNGVAPDSKPFTFNTAGTFYFYAEYSGDAHNIGPVNSGCASEPLVINPATPAPHSTPVVQIKDTFSVSGFSSGATGSVVVSLYSNSTCTTQLDTTSFPIAGNLSNGTLTNETTFTTVLSGSYFYQITYAGDANNTGFTSACTSEKADITITSLP
jgi:hypothetical protein